MKLTRNSSVGSCLEMSKSFAILRAMVFVFVLTIVLAFIPIPYGDVKTSLIVSVGTFVLSVVIAGILMFIFRRGGNPS